MSRRRFKVEEVTVGVDGEVTDAAVEAAVARAAEENPESTITHRLDRIAADLRELPQAYALGWETWSRAGAPLRSPVYDRRRSGKPESATPPEADGDIRVRLVVCAQRLAIALRILAQHNWLASVAWHPVSLQAVHVVVRHPRVEVPAYDARTGHPRWRDAEDITVEPVSIAPAVSQLRGAVEMLRQVDWSVADAADRDTVLDVLHEVEAGVGAIRSKGLWSVRHVPDPTPKVCSRKGCWKEVRERAGSVCVSCTSREYRARKKAS